MYRASGSVCRECPAFGVFTRDGTYGRGLEVGPHDAALRSHRAWMETEEAKQAYGLRKQLVEPVFGIVKEQLGARRFLLRGLANVKAEWAVLATAFNLRTPAFGVCTRAKEIGRSLAIGPHDAVLRRHRAWMSTSAAREAYKLRKQLVEPVFGIIKEQQGARRFLLRGLVDVAAEWTMLATAFNLRTLWRVWRSSPFIGLFNGPEPCPVS